MRKRIKDMPTSEIKLRLGQCLKKAPKANGKAQLGLRALAYTDALKHRRDKDPS